MAIRKKLKRKSDSELGFVGLGTEESFVSVERLSCIGVYGDGLQLSNEYQKKVDPREAYSGGTISFFAQFDAMDAILTGHHFSFTDKVQSIVSNLLETKYGATLSDAASDAYEIIEEIERLSQVEFVNPFFDSIRAYSVQELAGLADSLIGVQVNSSVFSETQSTVGGLIEVATIDVRKGVVWHRRLPFSKIQTNNSQD